MYSEIKLIELIPDKKMRLQLYADFIVEYSGWLQHLKEVGHLWGAGGEAVGAAKEAIKAKDYVGLLKNKIVEEAFS